MTSAVLSKTVARYRGDYAREYEARRQSQERWQVEDAAVRDMLGHLPAGTSVLDIPCGTGRFLPFFEDRGFVATGMDINRDMLDEAHRKSTSAELCIGDAQAIQRPDHSFDVAVCVRLLNLIDVASMECVVRELQRVARSMVIFTLRIGDDRERGQRHRKHPMAALESAIAPGWRIDEARLIHRNAWHMVRLCAGSM